MMVIVPSGAILTHGLIALPARAGASTAATAPPGSANVKERPAAPIITWRRDITAEWLIGWFMLRLPRRALDRAHDALIGAASADVGVHVFDNFIARRIRLLLEKVRGAHDLARLAVAADRKSTRL